MAVCTSFTRAKYNDPYDDDDDAVGLVMRFWFSGALYSNNIKIFTYLCVWLVLSYVYYVPAPPLSLARTLSVGRRAPSATWNDLIEMRAHFIYIR